MNTIIRKVIAFVIVCFSLTTISYSYEANAATKKLSPSKKKIEIDQKLTVKLKIKAESVDWSLSGSSIKIVDSNNKKAEIIGVEEGKTKLIAKVGKKKYSCTITVKAPKDSGTKSNNSDNSKTTKDNNTASGKITISVTDKNGVNHTYSFDRGLNVWKTKTGKKFHNKDKCGSTDSKKAEHITVEEAIETYGLEPCENCFGD